jgi:hypothetical protein
VIPDIQLHEPHDFRSRLAKTCVITAVPLPIYYQVRSQDAAAGH